ncbi:hypothetical protein CDAR_507881 [Caerostris darwini]|uniref:Uncharacterized protein n=1 Tax=Caerostris darwini TaxID=1538125 RepID=A0AAV4X4N9_9ARAC|nr:hypothetical protein CDAR_507881 [Caerostris darwini]
MDKCKHCLTNANNVCICPLVQKAIKVMWVEPSYQTTKHGEVKLESTDEADRSLKSEAKDTPWEKNKTSYGRSTRGRRSKAGVWARSMEFLPHKLTFEGDDDGYPM